MWRRVPCQHQLNMGESGLSPRIDILLPRCSTSRARPSGRPDTKRKGGAINQSINQSIVWRVVVQRWWCMASNGSSPWPVPLSSGEVEGGPVGPRTGTNTGRSLSLSSSGEVEAGERGPVKVQHVRSQVPLSSGEVEGGPDNERAWVLP